MKTQVRGTIKIERIPGCRLVRTIAPFPFYSAILKRWSEIPTGFIYDEESVPLLRGTNPSTCTTGVGYWATNQNCDNLDGMVGANPSTPISGTLYKCTNVDVENPWEAYYTPYTYPHPLRVQKFTGNIMIGGGGYYN